MIGLAFSRCSPGDRADPLQIGVRFLEVVVVQHHLAGDKGRFLLPFPDDVVADARILQVQMGFDLFRIAWLVRRSVVDQDKFMPVRGMIEVVIDPFAFQQPADEGKVRLFMLDTILQRRQSARLRAVDECRLRMIGEDGPDDFQRRLLLEYARVSPLVEQPKPWTDFQQVVRTPGIVYAHVAATCDETVVVSRPSSRQLQGRRGGLSDQGDKSLIGSLLMTLASNRNGSPIRSTPFIHLSLVFLASSAGEVNSA